MCLMGLSVLRFYKDYQKCMEKHPEYGAMAVGQDPFTVNLVDARQRAGVSPETFARWMQDVSMAFSQKNCYAVSLEKAPDGMKIEARPLMDRLTSLEQVTATTGTLIQQLIDGQKEIAHTAGKLSTVVGELSTMTRQLLVRTERLEHIIGTMAGTASPTLPGTLLPPGAPTAENSNDHGDIDTNGVPLPLPGVGVVTTKCYDQILFHRYGNRSIPLEKLFSMWFVEQLPIAYENYKAERSRKKGLPARQTAKYHKKIKSHFSISKTTIHVILKNMDEYPVGGVSACQLEEIAKAAIDKIRCKHGLKNRPSRTLLADGKHCLFKVGEYLEKVPFPENTPKEVKAWFNARGNPTNTPRENTTEDTVV